MFKKCEGCKKNKVYLKGIWESVKRQEVTLPTGHVALSKKLLCKSCQRLVQKAVLPTNGQN